MLHDHEPPEVGKGAFHCPSCGAYAHQTWYQTQVLRLDDEATELVPEDQAENPTLSAPVKTDHLSQRSPRSPSGALGARRSRR